MPASCSILPNRSLRAACTTWFTGRYASSRSWRGGFALTGKGQVDDTGTRIGDQGIDPRHIDLSKLIVHARIDVHVDMHDQLHIGLATGRYASERVARFEVADYGRFPVGPGRRNRVAEPGHLMGQGGIGGQSRSRPEGIGLDLDEGHGGGIR